MNERRHRLISAIAFVPLLIFGTRVSGVISQTSSWKGRIVKEGDVTVVHNPKEPMYKSDILSSKEEWAVGGAKARPDAAFSYIRHIVLDESENIYALDSKESIIRVFDADGRFLRLIGKKGDGPGELSSPLRLSINRTKKELVVSQNSRRLSYFDLEGRYLRALNTGSRWIPQAEVDSAGHIIGMEADFGDREAWFVLSKFDEGMTVIAELARKPVPESTIAGDPFAPIPTWDIDDYDDIIFGFPDRYEIIVFGPSNKIERIIRKEYDPVEVKRDETPAFQPAGPPGSKIPVSKYHSAYQSFFRDGRGYLFVRTWIPGPNQKGFVYDIFDEEGRYLASQPFAGRLWIVRTNHFYSIEEEEDGFHVLKKYAVSWNIR